MRSSSKFITKFFLISYLIGNQQIVHTLESFQSFEVVLRGFFHVSYFSAKSFQANILNNIQNAASTCKWWSPEKKTFQANEVKPLRTRTLLNDFILSSATTLLFSTLTKSSAIGRICLIFGSTLRRVDNLFYPKLSASH